LGAIFAAGVRAKRRGDFASVGEMLEELARRADRRRRRGKAERLGDVQLELPFPTNEPSAAKPLADLFPEAYQ
jgi:hypothetical protein